jgi:hypothetical protein
VQADAQADVALAGPRARGHRALDRERGGERVRRPLEHREDLVRAGVDLAAARGPHRRPHPAADLGDELRVLVPELREELRRALQIGQEERDVALGQPALGLELRADEPDRHDAVLVGRPQQPDARPVARRLVLERHLAEAGQRVAHVRGRCFFGPTRFFSGS